jgi:RNA-directed DNA polymerase
MTLEAVYEQDFLECSYGFRPGRSAHDALNALRNELMLIGSGWVLEADIRKFFDTLEHGHLRQLLRQRVRDGVLLSLIGKWLNAGILTEGELSHPEAAARKAASSRRFSRTSTCTRSSTCGLSEW